MALNDKQQLFADEYLLDLNATQAAKRAGYSADTAYSQGQRLLKDVEIHAYVVNAMEERSKKTMIDAAFVVENLKNVALRCMQANPVMKFDPVEMRMVQVKDEEDRDVWEFDSNGANRALELLGKHTGAFEKDNSQKKPVTVNDEILTNLVNKLNE